MVKKAVVCMLRFYQKVISPLFGPQCRFQPTCSEYCIESVQEYGVFVGVVKGIRRLLKCHPFTPPTFDPVKKR